MEDLGPFKGEKKPFLSFLLREILPMRIPTRPRASKQGVHLLIETAR